MLEKAMWSHGHSMVVEYPDRIASEWRAGFFIRVTGRPGTSNWFHFAIPTPVIVDNDRLRIDSAMLRFRTGSALADVTNVHIFDGERQIAAYDGLNLSPPNWDFLRFNVPGRPEVFWGIGVTVGVRFDGSTEAQNQMEFASAGVDFLS